MNLQRMKIIIITVNLFDVEVVDEFKVHVLCSYGVMFVKGIREKEWKGEIWPGRSFLSSLGLSF